MTDVRTNSNQQAFQWPPRPIDPDTLAAPAKSVPDPPRPPAIPDHRAAWWSRVEHAWLDPIADKLENRAADANWSPDPLDLYCDRCAGTIGPHESTEFGCANCTNSRLPWERAVRLGEYVPPLSDWIAEVKFTRWRAVGLKLGRMLGGAIRRAGAHSLDLSSTVVVPVPMSFRRRLSRGIDHTHVLAAGVASELKLPLVNALWRKHRPSQRAVAPSARASNVANAIFPRRNIAGLGPTSLTNKTVLLIDDVTTTGATLRAAARALRKGMQPPKAIWVCVLASTHDPDRRHIEPVSGPAVDEIVAVGI